MAQDLARLLASLNGSKIQSQNNSLYQTIKGLIDAVREFQVSLSATAITEIIEGVITPSDTVADLDGSNVPGVSLLYSRGDHKHDYGPNSVAYGDIQAVSAASRLLGRGTAGGSNIREISLGTGLSMAADVLSATAVSSVDHVVMSDGATPTPSPVDDGFGNFIYIPYTP